MNRRVRWVISLGAALAGSIFVRDAAAQSAEELFDRGWDAMERRDYEAACALFDGSYGMSRATGPLQGLAACYEARGLLRQSLSLWREAARALPQDSPSLPEVRRAVERLEARIATVKLQLAQDAVRGTTAEVDGEVVALDGPALELDPLVAHLLIVKRPGEPSERLDLRLGEGEDKTLVVGRPLGPLEEKASDARATQETPSIGPVRGVGIGLLGLGAVGFVAAAVTGGLMIAHEQTIDAGCRGPDHTDCDATALAASDSAKALSGWNIAAWVAGGAATAAGLTMVIVGDRGASETSPEVAVSVTGPSLLVRGSF